MIHAKKTNGGLIYPGQGLDNPDDEGKFEFEPMTPEQYRIALIGMSLGAKTIKATKKVLVDGRQPADVANELKMDASQLSRTVKNIMANLDQNLISEDFVKMEVFVPRANEGDLRGFERTWCKSLLEKATVTPRREKKKDK